MKVRPASLELWAKVHRFDFPFWFLFDSLFIRWGVALASAYLLQDGFAAQSERLGLHSEQLIAHPNDVKSSHLSQDLAEDRLGRPSTSRESASPHDPTRVHLL